MNQRRHIIIISKAGYEVNRWKGSAGGERDTPSRVAMTETSLPEKLAILVNILKEINQTQYINRNVCFFKAKKKRAGIHAKAGCVLCVACRRGACRREWGVRRRWVRPI